LFDERSRRAVDVAERFADDCAGEDERHCAAADASRARSRDWNDYALSAAYDRVGLNSPANHPDAEWGMVMEVVMGVENVILQRSALTSLDNARSAERGYQSRLLRDIFGQLPFRPVTCNRAWRTATVTSLAQAIYEERAFDRMPIMADALEDAGCADADVLGHCRGDGEHVRGCWVVDLVLGKDYPPR